MNIEDTLKRMAASDIKQVRFAWCDLHGALRSTTLMPLAVEDALKNGVEIFNMLDMLDGVQLKDHANLILKPTLSSYQELPWAPGTAWLQGQLQHTDGRAVDIDTRHILRTALEKLEAQGFGLHCGLEVDFYIYKIESTRPQLDPDLAGWPGLPPAVSMLHPGYQRLSEHYSDMSDAALRTVRDTAQALGLPLTALGIACGPSQFKAAFEATDALSAADDMVLFISAARQALQRAGYHASFMCRPPFAHTVASRWHVQHYLVRLDDQSNAFALPSLIEAQQDWYQRAMSPLLAMLPVAKPLAATSYLSPVGCHYLAGLLHHAPASAALSRPELSASAFLRSINVQGYVAPQAASWSCDQPDSALRILAPQDQRSATRIENRAAQPLANPYLHLACQIYAGLDGITRKLAPPPGAEQTKSSGAAQADEQPSPLERALDALTANKTLCADLGQPFVNYFCQIKRQELAHYEAANDKVDWLRRTLFARY